MIKSFMKVIGLQRVLPPGTVLQLMYLRERLEQIPPGSFLEIGPGSGEVTQLLLDLGWTGKSYDLDNITIEVLRNRFANEIILGKYSAMNVDYLKISDQPKSVDLVISCMVMEHLDDCAESLFMLKSITAAKPTGLMIGLVPGSPSHWGIEDEVAGHCRRYTRERILTLMTKSGWALVHFSGLTYPISNLLLPISNYLVNRNEKLKLELSALEKTKLSGHRNVKFKTHFPSFLGFFLNRITLWPLFILQKLFKNSDHSLVIYFESKPSSLAGPS